MTAIFSIVTHSFLDFARYFWDFVTHYSDSVILLRWLGYFATVSRSFFYPVGHFLDFIVRYSDSDIFCYTALVIF
jgi:hypothetical protein